MRIYIPTLGRRDKQITFNTLTKFWQERTWFVVHRREVELFKGHPNLVVVEKIGAPHARQTAVDHCLKGFLAGECSASLFMFDDDLRFSQRVKDWNIDTNVRLEQMSPDDLHKALEFFQERLDDYAAVGMSARGMNNQVPDHPYKEAGRLMRAFGVRADILDYKKIRFDKFEYWEDFHVTLELLKNGYATYVSTAHCNDGITNADGGCSEYRNRDGLLKTRGEFIEYHAPYVKANDKSSESWGNTDESTMPDIRIAWVKCYEDAVRRFQNLSLIHI